MSWCSGSQLTMRTGGCSFTAMKICSTLVTMDLWVRTTPAGVRVEPEVYCRNASSELFGASSGCLASSSAGFCHCSARLSGRASATSTRGRSGAGRSAKNSRTAAAERLLVMTATGVEESSTAVRWSAWPGSVGS